MSGAQNSSVERTFNSISITLSPRRKEKVPRLTQKSSVNSGDQRAIIDPPITPCSGSSVFPQFASTNTVSISDTTSTPRFAQKLHTGIVTTRKMTPAPVYSDTLHKPKIIVALSSKQSPTVERDVIEVLEGMSIDERMSSTNLDADPKDQQQINGDASVSKEESMKAEGSRAAETRRKLYPCHIEVRLSRLSHLRTGIVHALVREYIQEQFVRLEVGADLEGWEDEIEALHGQVDRIVVAECTSPDPYPLIEELKIHIHVYQPSHKHALEEFSAAVDDDEPDVMAATVQELPARSLDGLWNTLIYSDDIKPRLLNYIHTTLVFSDADVDFNVVTWNRVVLLHGPPGTGKTSLCRALAQKLAIRLADRYSSGKLVEINSHSLFSKWFSESGKLVQKLFSRVTEMIDDENCFVVVLIDEVESLTAARTASGTEPSDALRVVNALLTQLDKLKHRKNVLVMATSNIADAIDSAFIDRADIKQYIGLPPPQAIYWVLKGCLEELMRRDLIQADPLLAWTDLERVLDRPATASRHEVTRQASLKLRSLAEACKGLSGRSLRRLPVLAHARYLDEDATLEEWINAMSRAVDDEEIQSNFMQ